MKPIILVAFQLLVFGVFVARYLWRHPSLVYRLAMLATILGVIGFDIWYFVDHAYPGGFSWGS